MARIGILNVRGAMPYYEELPFNILVDGPGIIKDLDLLILPPGTLVESQVLQRYGWVEKEVWEYVERGGFVVGVCSGTQLLSRAVNLNVKGLPGYSRGLGVLDIVFEPFIVTGPVRVRITRESWATRGLEGLELRGWQAHTYGMMNVLSSDVQVVGVSRISRYNYRNTEVNAPTLVASRRYNVFGTMVHGILGQGSPIMRNILREVGIGDDEVANYYRNYRERDWGNVVSGSAGSGMRGTRVLVVASTTTGEGKTLIASALTHCLNGAGYYVGIAKLAGDIRDLHPGLYILNKPFKPWMSIRLRWGSRSLGWVGWREALRHAQGIGLDVLIVEGVMGLLTGSSRRYRRGFSSTLDFIRLAGADAVLMASASLDGVEGALFRLGSYVNLLIRQGRKPLLTILNNAYGGAHEKKLMRSFKERMGRLGIPFITIGSLPMSSKPEELIDLEDYREAAMEVSNILCNALINALGRSWPLWPGNH